MQSNLVKALKLRHNPVALIWSDEKPADAKQFASAKWGCVMMLFAQTAARGKTAVFDRETFGCFGGGVGLGFGNQYENFDGGMDGFCHFLSIGNNQWETGREYIAGSKYYSEISPDDNFVHGERYLKSPKTTRKFVEGLPIINIPTKYVIFKPLSEVDENKADVKVVIFPVNPHQLSALIILANYTNPRHDKVIAPFCAGCQSVGIMPLAEIDQEHPRAIIGMSDISARNYTKKTLGNDVMTFAIPLKMFHTIDQHVKDSFLEKSSWTKLINQ